MNPSCLHATPAGKTFCIIAYWLCCHFITSAQAEQLWYKRAVIYNLDIATFKDSDGNGKGDIKGLITKLPYLRDMGVNVIWLAPFFPSPCKDDGYDVRDYYNVDTSLGNISDMKALIAQAHQYNMKIIVDLILNHTSDQHLWFQKARAGDTAFRPWYVWSGRRPDDANKGMVFPGVQTETWSYDTLAGAYYFHRFYRFQPDLNYTNVKVQQEAFAIIRYWLKVGLDGYRLDAVPFIIDIPETGAKRPQRMLWLVTAMAEEVRRINKDAILLGEANLSPDENADYFGREGKGLDMMFNFYVNQYLFYSFAVGNVKLLIKALEDTKEKPARSQWTFFLRNHDEIDLARLSRRQRKKVYRAFGPDSSMQLYDRGIRRRLAPMMQNDTRQLKMAYSLLFSLPGTPVVRYGEEIGMGDDLHLPERLSVRTPMQWSAAANAGFSNGDTIFRNVISEGVYSYKNVNVDKAAADTASLLNYVRKMIVLRKQHPEIGYAAYRILKTRPEVLALLYTSGKGRLLLLHNFSKDTVKVKWPVVEGAEVSDLMGNAPEQKSSGQITIEGYGCRWLELQEP